MKKWLLILILLAGCHKHAPDVDLQLATEGKTFTEVSTKTVDKAEIPKIGGKEPEDLIALITVPASTVPTTIAVYDKKKSLKDKLKPRGKKDPVHPADIASSTPGTKAYTPEVTPWWYYALGIMVFLSAALLLIKKYTKLLAKPIEVIMRLFGK